MSLINDTLRELDARNASAAERKGLADNVRALPGEPPRFRLHPLLLALIAALLGGGAMWLIMREPAPPAQTSAPAIEAQALEAEREAPAAILPEPTAESADGESQTLAPLDPAELISLAQLTPSLQLDSSIRQMPRRAEARTPPPAQAEVREASPDKAPQAAPQAPKPETAPPARAPAAQPVQAEAPQAPASTETPRISRQASLDSGASPGEAEYQRGIAALRRGQTGEGGELFRAALRLSPAHIGARQALLSQLGEQQRWSEMEALALEGVALLPQRSDWALLAARLMYERGDAAAALATLDRSAATAGRNADYQILHALLLARAARNAEAVVCYQAALALRPDEGRWWFGLARALEAEGRAAEAAQAYEKALQTGNLPPELQQALEQRLR